MAKFLYTAKDRDGNTHKGTIETSDPHQVARILSKRGLILIAAKEQSDRDQPFYSKFFNRISFTDVVIATRQLATMVESGLVLSDALDILADQQSPGSFKTILADVSQDVKNGLDLATSLRKHPEAFPPLYCSLVKAGEQAGKLDTILTQMATNLERDREFRSRIRGAMIYPILVMTMMGVVVMIMMLFVVPRLVSFYAQSNIDLPVTTKLLIFMSNIFVYYWWMMILAVVVGFILFKRWVATTRGKYQYDAILLKTPVIGRVIRGTSLTNFTRTFGLLTHAGLAILDSIMIVSEIVGNEVYKKALQDCYRGIERGLTMSAQLDATGAFPKIVSQMYRVGEETGKVDVISFKLAEYFESETDHLVKNLTVIIEPTVLIVLGVGVGFLVISLILPIYKLTTSFN